MQSSSCSGNWSLPVMLIVDLSLARVVQHSPFQFYAHTRVVPQINGALGAYVHAHDDHYLTRSKFNSLLTEMITPQTYIQVYIKPLPVPRVFGARSGSPRIIGILHSIGLQISVIASSQYSRQKNISTIFTISHTRPLSWCT